MILSYKFHSLEHFNADSGMANLLELAGMRSSSIEHSDIIVFNGGVDIGTMIYHEQPIQANIPYLPSARDRAEIAIFEKYKSSEKLLLGICRGSQFLNCMNGGTLWQDVNNHGRDHIIADVKSGNTYVATSTHHQMMRPASTGEILAVADIATYKYSDPDNWHQRDGLTFPDAHKDTEIVWYKGTGSLCIQGHPEYVPGSHFANYCLKLIRQYCDEVQSVAA